MSMAIFRNGKFQGVMNTSMGKLTFYQKDGLTVTRTAMSDRVDNQSAAQMYQRLKMLTCAPLYKVLKDATALGWENVPKGQSQYNCFTAGAMRSTPFGITQELHKKGAGIAWPAQITSGSLPVISVDDNNETDIVITGLSSLTTATTVADFAKAVVDGNPGRFEYDDEIAFIEVLQTVDAKGTPKISCTRSAIELNAKSKETLFSLPSSKGFALGTNGHLAMKGSPRVGGFCWVHSRVDNGTMLVSTQSLICNNDAVLQTYSGADRLREAARSFGADLLSAAFLKPNGTRSRIALEAFGINLKDVKGTVGSTTPNIVGFSLKDAVYFAGDKSPIYDKAVTQQIKLSLSTLEGLDESNLKLSINGTECTSVVVSGDANTVVATIPASMDGEAIKSVAIGDNDKTFSIKMA